MSLRTLPLSAVAEWHCGSARVQSFARTRLNVLSVKPCPLGRSRSGVEILFIHHAPSIRRFCRCQCRLCAAAPAVHRWFGHTHPVHVVVNTPNGPVVHVFTNSPSCPVHGCCHGDVVSLCRGLLHDHCAGSVARSNPCHSSRSIRDTFVHLSATRLCPGCSQGCATHHRPVGASTGALRMSDASVVTPPLSIRTVTLTCSMCQPN